MDAEAWDERYRVADRLWSSTPNIFVADRLADHEPGTGLDLASGEGRNAIWLAERGWDMTAVDFSSVALDRGRAISDRVHFVEADV
ncbi:MAG TPA: class I SAM-dependent methyltransferase, partial [Acidimicrobiia bacterium]|nr:class I SAM-dependent methyltransferase [Acidimicrobiia bacterium]